jgi:hypothetical protein
MPPLDGSPIFIPAVAGQWAYVVMRYVVSDIDGIPRDELVFPLPIIGWTWAHPSMRETNITGARGGMRPVFPEVSIDEVYSFALPLPDGRFFPETGDFPMTEEEARDFLLEHLREYSNFERRRRSGGEQAIS